MGNNGNVLEDLPERLPDELIQVLAQSDSIRIERIVSFGHASAPEFWYDQATSEWVMVVRGKAGLEFEDDPNIVELGPGDYVNIAAHRRHRVAWTTESEPTIWLAVHY
jgi:cupin 2 domain-containing protein